MDSTFSDEIDFNTRRSFHSYLYKENISHQRKERENAFIYLTVVCTLNVLHSWLKSRRLLSGEINLPPADRSLVVFAT